MDPMDPKFIRWVRSAPEIGLRSFHDCGLHNWNLRIFICIYMYLYVFICIYHNFPYNFHEQILCHLLSILGSASYFPGLRPLVACAWCRSPWTRRWHSKGLESSRVDFHCNQVGPEWKQLHFDTSVVALPEVGTLGSTAQLGGCETTTACQPLTFKPPNHQTVTLSSYAPSRHTTSRILRASFWVLQV